MQGSQLSRPAGWVQVGTAPHIAPRTLPALDQQTSRLGATAFVWLHVQVHTGKVRAACSSPPFSSFSKVGTEAKESWELASKETTLLFRVLDVLSL